MVRRPGPADHEGIDMSQSTADAPIAEETRTGRMFMVVTLKSGVQLRVDVDEYTVGLNGLGELKRLKWKANEATTSNIKYVDLDQVVAVHTEWPEGAPGE